MIDNLEQQLSKVIKTKDIHLIPFRELADMVSKGDIQIKKRFNLFKEVYLFKIGKIKIFSSKEKNFFDYFLHLGNDSLFGEYASFSWGSVSDLALRLKIEGVYDSVSLSYSKNK